jgi:thioredoxin-like negative regulator of GroEL
VQGVVFVAIDVDASPALATKYGATALPLFVLLKNGKKIDTLVGAQQTNLRKKIIKHK